VNWQTVGIVSGAALLGAASLQTIGAAFLARRRLRAARTGVAHRQQAFDQQLQASVQWARAAKPIFKAWSGTRSFRVAAVVNEAIDSQSFYLVPVDGRPLPRFEPGQFLTFSLPVDPRMKPLVRCYSFSDRPREDYYRVTIKRVLPAGSGSGYFHDRVEVGTILQAQTPQGAFFLDPTDRLPVVLVGAGIGITPIMSMIHSIIHDHGEQTAYVFGGFGNSREQPFRKQLSELDAAHDNLHVDISYSRPMPADRVERDFHHRGRIDIARLREVLPSNNFQFYVCGPAGMMEDIVPALVEWGVPESHIHFEAFGPASVKGVSAPQTLADTEPCNVEFLLAHASLAWNVDCGSLLDLAESGGVSLDYGCRAGNCGQCLVKVRQGQVTHVKPPGLPVAKDECLACVGVPQGDVVLEA